MTHNFKSLLFVVALATIGAPTKAKAEEGGKWISRELAAKDYNISSFEEDGVYYCSIRDGKVIDTQLENGYALIIFERDAPRFFLAREMSRDLLRQFKAIEVGQFYSVLCIHSFFRNDWQERYDAEHTVTDKLLDIKKRAEELVEVP